MWNPHIIRESMDCKIPADITVSDKERELLKGLAAGMDGTDSRQRAGV